MPATRPDLLIYLANDQALKRFAGRYGVSMTDTPEGYSGVLDSAARALGFDADLVGFSIPTEQIAKAQDVAKYFALAMFYEVAALESDVEVDVPRQVQKSSQRFTQLGKLVARYELIVTGYGIPVGSPQAQIEIGRLGLDYLYPTSFVGEEVTPSW